MSRALILARRMTAARCGSIAAHKEGIIVWLKPDGNTLSMRSQHVEAQKKTDREPAIVELNNKTPASKLIQKYARCGIWTVPGSIPTSRMVRKVSGTTLTGAREDDVSPILIAESQASSCLDAAAPNESGHRRREIGQFGFVQPTEFRRSKWPPRPAEAVLSAAAEFSDGRPCSISWPQNG